ncbi:MAG: sodium:solute symporter [Clostridia bacterium]|nr:sodium:solute symporter [Clostridia bacterium]
MTQIIALVALIIFAAILVLIGVYSTKKSLTLDGFLLGGRNVGAWLSAFSYGTTYFSAVIFIGYAGTNGWKVGLGSMWIGIGNAIIGSAIAWILLAKRTRNMTRRLNSRTMPEFFASRYSSKAMKIFSAIIVFVFLVPYASSVYKGLGSLFGSIFPNTLFGISPEIICMFIVAILASVYLVLGGYMASAVSNLVQGVVMIGGVVLMILALVYSPEVGGFGAAIEKLNAVDPALTDIFGGNNFQFLLMNILLTSFGTWGLPQMVHKYYAIKSEKDIKIGAVIATVFAIIIGCGAYFAGSLGRFFVEANPDGTPVVGYDYVVPTMLNNALGSTFWGSILLSVVLLCVLSASMSTLSSVVLTSSSSITVDLAEALNKGKEINKKKQMIWTRTLCFAFIAISFIAATFNVAIIVSIMSFSWGVVSGCFIGPYVWGLYSKKITKAGAWAGMHSGVVVVGTMLIVDMIKVGFDNGIMAAFTASSSNAALYGIVAMAVSLVIVPVVSLFTQKLTPVPEADIEKAFVGNVD